MHNIKNAKVESTNRFVNLIIRNTFNVIRAMNISNSKYNNMKEQFIIIYI